MAVVESEGTVATEAELAIRSEIDAAIDAVIAETRPPAKDVEDDKTDDNDQDSGGEPSTDKEEDEALGVESAQGESDDKAAATPPPAKVEIPDELMERAVRLGIPLSEVKKYPDEALLSAMCDRLDTSVAAESSGQASAGDSSSGSEVEDLLASVPNLDPEEFGEEVVGAFDALKGALKQLVAASKETAARHDEEIRGLRGERSSDWLNSRVAAMGLGEVNPSKMVDLRAKFGVLEAGYKSAGQEVGREAVFEEAAKLVLGSDIAAARDSETAAKLEKRSKQQISRPSGRKAKPKGNAFEEVAAEIEQLIRKG